jgi:hypothetical protein
MMCMEFNNSKYTLLFFFYSDNVNLKLNLWPVFAVITLLVYDAGLTGLM